MRHVARGDELPLDVSTKRSGHTSTANFKTCQRAAAGGHAALACHRFTATHQACSFCRTSPAGSKHCARCRKGSYCQRRYLPRGALSPGDGDDLHKQGVPPPRRGCTSAGGGRRVDVGAVGLVSFSQSYYDVLATGALNLQPTPHTRLPSQPFARPSPPPRNSSVVKPTPRPRLLRRPQSPWPQVKSSPRPLQPTLLLVLLLAARAPFPAHAAKDESGNRFRVQSIDTWPLESIASHTYVPTACLWLGLCVPKCVPMSGAS